MIALPVLMDVDKNLAKQVTKILRDHGWDADHQKSHPVCEVLVKAEQLRVDSLRKILESHVERNESGVAMTLRQKLKLSQSLPQNPEADLTSEIGLPDYRCLSPLLADGKHLPIIKRAKKHITTAVRRVPASVPTFIENRILQLLENELKLTQGRDFHFKYAIPPYYPDFAFPSRKQVIEAHSDFFRPADSFHERKRLAAIQERGWKVLVLREAEIKRDFNSTKRKIREFLGFPEDDQMRPGITAGDR